MTSPRTDHTDADRRNSIDRLYLAFCRHQGWLVEPPAPADATLRALLLALDAVTEADIRLDMMAPEPPDTIYERLLEIKLARTQEQAGTAPARQPPRAQPGSDQDSEPEQGA